MAERSLETIMLYPIKRKRAYNIKESLEVMVYDFARYFATFSVSGPSNASAFEYSCKLVQSAEPLFQKIILSNVACHLTTCVFFHP